jgi:hypothetical protein
MLLTNHFRHYFSFLFLIVILSQCKEAPTEPIYVRPDLIQVTIISPTDSSIIYEPLVIFVIVESQNPIIQVNFSIDNKIIGADTESPYSIAPDITPWADNEIHTLKCLAEDNLHNVNSTKVSITISDQVKSNIALLEPEQNDTIRNDNRVNLKWLHDPVKKFRIQISRDVSFNDIIQYDSTNQKSFLSRQLEKGSYYWRIGYYSEELLDIYWSGFRRFIIDGPKVPIIISPQSEEIRKFNIANTFIWNKPEFAVQYQFQIADYYTDEIIYDDILSDTLIIKNLELYVYKVKVKAKNSVNIWSEWSAEVILSNGLFTKEFVLPNELSVTGCLELPDSGFVIASFSLGSKYTRLMKVDALGIEEFNSNIPNFMINEFAVTSDNNIIMVGNNDNYYSKVLKIDQSFNTLWEYEPLDNDKIYLTNVTVTQSGEYLLIGLYNEDYVTSYKQIYYSALSNSGTPLFERLVGDPSSIGYHIEEFNNGYLIMAIQNDTIIGSDAIYNLLIDMDGSVVSEYKYLEFLGFPGQNYQVRDGLRMGNDIYCVGNFGSRYGSFVHKSDIFGTEYWKINLTNLVPSSAEKCIPTVNGNLLIGGDAENLFLFEMGPNGNIIWSFDNAYDYTYCKDLLITLDGGIILLASSSLATRTVRIIKLNSDGVTYKN